MLHLSEAPTLVDFCHADMALCPNTQSDDHARSCLLALSVISAECANYLAKTHDYAYDYAYNYLAKHFGL